MCRKPAESMQESCRKQAGNTPHSLPEHLFYFHHSSFWQTGIKPYPRPQGEPGLAPAAPHHCSSPCSGWLRWFLPQGRAGAACLLTSSVSPQVFQAGFICRRKPHERLYFSAAWPEQDAATLGQNKTSIHGRTFKFPAVVPSQHTHAHPRLLSMGAFGGFFPG